MSINQWADSFYRSILSTPLVDHLPTFATLIQDWNATKHHGEQAKWHKQLQQFPNITPSTYEFGDTVTFGNAQDISEGAAKHLKEVLKCYMPWRKGPFEIFGIHIDTEWRSDFKWQRILDHLPDLNNKRVLDVGCGSGYHLFRMSQAGAQQVIGIDPTTLFFYQFHCFKRYTPNENIHYLPFALEKIPPTAAFDVVFSMGVLYHRQDPLGFLHQLKQQLSFGGKLVLETLIIDDEQQQLLMPSERYAQMRNVYFIPSASMMIQWLNKVGFSDVRLIEQNHTTTNEQRSTEWMQNHSLENFLDPHDNEKTIEGYPAPLRATFFAQK